MFRFHLLRRFDILHSTGSGRLKLRF